MNRSAGLSALTRRGGPRRAGVPATRPDGQVLWVHATSDLRLAMLCDLARHLTARRDDLFVIGTYDPAQVSAPGDGACPELEALVPLYGSGTGPGRQLIQSWRPDAGLWTGGQLGNPVLRQASDAGTRLILLDADPETLRGRKRRWFSDPVHEGLTRFEQVLVPAEQRTLLIQRSGLPDARVQATGPLRLDPAPPSCPDEELSEVSQELRGRPVWLAAFPHPDEFGYVVAAHRNAVRHSHRLLLVVVLEDRDRRADLLALMGGVTLRHMVWTLGDAIDDQVQALVIDDPEDLGLWYRIAPQVFLGHSLIKGQAGRDPMHAAALGSAILHGPEVMGHADAYDRLTQAGAAQRIPDGAALGAQVARLIAPDLAAEMALAGWDVATQGAELTARVMTLTEDLLDGTEADDAST